MRTRNRQVNIRMTEKEYLQIKKKADRLNMNFSTYIIKTACDRKITIINDFDEFNDQLRRAGNNLNQLTVLCHQGKITSPNLQNAIDVFCKIYDAITALIEKCY